MGGGRERTEVHGIAEQASVKAHMPMFDPVEGTYVPHPSRVKAGPHGSFFPRLTALETGISWSLREKVLSTEMDPLTEGCARMIFSEYAFRKCVKSKKDE